MTDIKTSSSLKYSLRSVLLTLLQLELLPVFLRPLVSAYSLPIGEPALIPSTEFTDLVAELRPPLRSLSEQGITLGHRSTGRDFQPA